MKGNTHQLGGVSAGLAGCILLTVGDTSIAKEMSPILAYPIIYIFSMIGSKLPDQDHNDNAIPFRDPLGKSIYYLLHATSKLRKYHRPGTTQHKLLGIADSRHRSWQTHSDLTLFGLLWLIWYLCFSGMESVGVVNSSLIQVVIGGIALGVLSHLILDAITPKGIWLIAGLMVNTVFGRHILPMKFRLIPKRSFFATGGPWEDIVNRFLTLFNRLLFLVLVFLLLDYYLNLIDIFSNLLK